MTKVWFRWRLGFDRASKLQFDLGLIKQFFSVLHYHNISLICTGYHGLGLESLKLLGHEGKRKLYKVLSKNEFTFSSNLVFSLNWKFWRSIKDFTNLGMSSLSCTYFFVCWIFYSSPSVPRMYINNSFNSSKKPFNTPKASSSYNKWLS